MNFNKAHLLNEIKIISPTITQEQNLEGTYNFFSEKMINLKNEGQHKSWRTVHSLSERVLFV